MDNSNGNVKRYTYLIALTLISMVAVINCIANSSSLPESFKELWVLPFCNMVVAFIFVGALIRGSFYLDIPIMVITALFTVRNAITPLVMSLTTVASRIGVYSNPKMINIGITVFIYETVAVYIYLYTIRNKPLRKRIRIITPWHAPNSTFLMLILGGIVFSVVAFILLPELRTQYYTIFTNDITHLIKEKVSYGGGIKRAISTSANMIIEATRLSLSSYIIHRLRKRDESWLTYLGCICVILAQFLFMNDSNAYVIMVAFALYMLVYKLYPKYGKITLRYLVIIIIAFCVLIYINRFSKDVYGTSLSVFLQAYFPGLNNFASIEPLLDRSIFDIIRQMLIDLYAAVPFRSTLFGYQGGLDALPTIWQDAAGLHGQIMPNVAQSYYYFGPFLCPILSIVLCSIGIKSFKKAEVTTNPCLYSAYMYLSLYACIAIVMYDFYIFMVMLLTRYMFMYIFSCFCKEQMVYERLNEDI